MKTTFLLTIFVLMLGSAAQAESPDSGFYIGGGGFLTWVDGTGTWSGTDFSIDQPLDNTAETLGFNWTDRLILGIKPLVGWRISPGFALQAGYALNIAKSSNQSVADTDLGSTYEAGFTSEWGQRNLEIFAVIHPNPDLGYFLFGGVEMVSVDMSITFYEGITYVDNMGNTISDYEYEKFEDDTSGLGAVIGAGWEFSSNRTTSAFVTAQYSFAKTSDSFFDTDDFDVKVGGLSFLLGVKWHPFNGGDEEASP